MSKSFESCWFFSEELDAVETVLIGVDVPVESFRSDFIDIFTEVVAIKSVDDLDDSSFLLKDSLEATIVDLKFSIQLFNIR